MLGTENVSLPGTHAIIFPWVPPENLPEKILTTIRDQLVSIFHEFDRIKSRSSTQSSPATGDEGGDAVEDEKYEDYSDLS